MHIPKDIWINLAQNSSKSKYLPDTASVTTLWEKKAIWKLVFGLEIIPV